MACWMRILVLVGCLVGMVFAPARARQASDEPGQAPSAERLGMKPGVVCRAVKGYRDYEPRVEARLTADEKLLVYYEPVGFGTARAGGQYRAHLVQDAAIRPEGKQTVLWKKAKVLEYEGKSARSDMTIYLMNSIAIKDLKPGRYELVIKLKDQISGEAAEQVVPFQVEKAESGGADSGRVWGLCPELGWIRTVAAC